MKLKLFELVEASKGKFLSVVFRKKDGTLRKLNGKVEKVHSTFIVLQDRQNGGYRTVYKDRITAVCTEGLIIKLNTK